LQVLQTNRRELHFCMDHRSIHPPAICSVPATGLGKITATATVFVYPPQNEGPPYCSAGESKKPLEILQSDCRNKACSNDV